MKLHPVILAIATLICAGPASAETLTILHTNDFHSRIEPITRFDNTCSAKKNAAGDCFGGSARLLTVVRAARSIWTNSILVDGGDQFQGTLFYTRYRGKAAAKMMNVIGYDGMTVGNHEFDDGPEVLRGFMDAVEFPVLTSNADVSREPQLADVLRASTVIERAGEKIGLIGLTAEDTSEIASPGKNVAFHDPVDAVKREIARLEAEGVTRIVVLSHSGYTVDKRVAAAVDGIDVIVGGHTNTFLSNTSKRAKGPYPTWVATPNGGRTAVVQAYAYGKFLGRLTVVFDSKGVVTAAEGEPILIDGRIVEDADLKARIALLAEPLEEIRNKVVGAATAAIGWGTEACRMGECAMANLVTDAMLARVKAQGISIAIQNGGGLRAAIDEGPITLGDVLTVLPFQNSLSTFQLKGSDVVAALESGVSKVESVDGRFPQVAGLRYTYTTSVEPNQGRISKVQVEKDGAWVPIDPAAIYGVVSNDYLRRGGNGYDIFSGKAENAYDFGPNLADVVAEYLTANGPYEPGTDGRISVE